MSILFISMIFTNREVIFIIYFILKIFFLNIYFSWLKIGFSMIESLFLLSIKPKIIRIIRIQPLTALASLQDTFLLLHPPPPLKEQRNLSLLCSFRGAVFLQEDLFCFKAKNHF